jgi:glycosyltransferase involved in cell wall biosynthesis
LTGIKSMGQQIRGLSFAVATHVYASGPAFFLEDYLNLNKAEKVLFIGIPFTYSKDKRPFFRYYEKGKLIEQGKMKHIPMPELIIYLRDILLVLYLVFRKGTFGVFIGVDNLNTVSGILLRLFGRVKRIVFYTIDYVPNRFSNKLLNNFYHLLEKTAVYKSDVVWNLSDEMRKQREKNGYDRKYKIKQIVVPIGTNPQKRIRSIKKDDVKTVVYMGHLREGQGVDFLIRSFAKLLKKMTGIRLLIVGGGELEKNLKALSTEMGIKNQIVFTGFVKDYKKVQKYLSESSLAVAPYVDDEKTFTRYTAPGKVKDYISSGLPVILTKVPAVYKQIDERKAGIAINYSEEELVSAIRKILLDNETLNNYRKNAFAFAQEITWKKVFDKAFDETVKRW